MQRSKTVTRCVAGSFNREVRVGPGGSRSFLLRGQPASADEAKSPTSNRARFAGGSSSTKPRPRKNWPAKRRESKTSRQVPIVLVTYSPSHIEYFRQKKSLHNTFVVAPLHILRYSNKAKFQGGCVYRREMGQMSSRKLVALKFGVSCSSLGPCALRMQCHGASFRRQPLR